MAETTQPTEQQEGSKTIVAFVVGLLIGGMLVWAFSGGDQQPVDTDQENTTTSEETNMDEGEEAATGDEPEDEAEQNNAETSSADAPQLEIGAGDITVADQPASAAIALESATYPISEGWIGVRDYNDGQLGFILGVVRFSEASGLIPDSIVLQRPTIPGQEYAVVIFSEDGDNAFNPAGDVQIDEIFATFTAQ